MRTVFTGSLRIFVTKNANYVITCSALVWYEWIALFSGVVILSYFPTD